MLPRLVELKAQLTDDPQAQVGVFETHPIKGRQIDLEQAARLRATAV